ncbi:hypothetical protein J7M02_05685 [Candidatus Aerophobetes bacterium]|nr:hypothetical protein [Candidatus Aerophobetes bacterium]
MQDKKINSSLLEKLFLKEVERVEKIWIKGTYRWLAQKYPKAYTKLNSLENTLNDIWRKAEEGKASLDDFTKALRAWSSYIRKAVSKRKEKEDSKT